MTDVLRPMRLEDNRVPVYYEGGARIDRFRGRCSACCGPEDWVGSASALPTAILPSGADPRAGISRLADGSLLTDAIAARPVEWLGEGLVATYGGNPGLLVKLLDAGERLPVHAHPDRTFSRAHLGSPFGKTEAWVVLDADPGAWVGLAFREDVAPGDLRDWIASQDVEAMLAAMHRFDARPGDVFYVPAGIPHTIGPGALIVELQEPTSFSLLAEYARYGLDEHQATLGLGWDAAIGAFDLRAATGERAARLRPVPERLPVTADAELLRLFDEAATPYFQAYRLHVNGTATLPLRGLAIAVVDRGALQLSSAGGTDEARAGETWIVPAAAAPVVCEGAASVLLCVPPEPSAAPRDRPDHR